MSELRAEGLRFAEQTRLAIVSGNRKRYALDRIERGKQCFERHDYPAAERLYEEALAVMSSPMPQPNDVDALSMRAAALGNLGMLKAAEAHFKAVIEDPAMLSAPTTLMTTLNNWGGVSSQRGAYATARQIHTQAQALAQRVRCSDRTRATLLANAAVAVTELGDLDSAVEMFDEAIAICEASADVQDDAYFATLLSNSAAPYLFLGDFERAIERSNRALKLFTQGESINLLESNVPARYPVDIAKCLHHLSKAYTASGQTPIAVLYANRAADILRAVVGEYHPDYVAMLPNLASLRAAAGYPTIAWNFFEQYLSSLRSAGPGNGARLIEGLFGFGRFLRGILQWDAAESALQECRAVCEAELGAEHSTLAQIYSELAFVRIGLDEPEQALQQLMAANAIIDRQLEHVFAMSSEEQRAAYLDYVEGHLHLTVSLVAEKLCDSASAVATAAELTLRRKGIGTEATLQQRTALLAGRYPELRPLFRELTDVRLRLAQLALSRIPSRESDALALKRRCEELEVQLARHVPETAQLRMLHAVSRDTICENLNPGTALVEILRVRHLGGVSLELPLYPTIPFELGCVVPEPPHETYVALVFVPSQPDNVALITLGEASVVDDLVGRVRNQIKSLEEWQQADAIALRAMILDPILTRIGHRTRLLIAPDGELNRLPFEILPLDEQTSAIDRYVLSYLNAGRDLLRFGFRTGVVAGPCAVFADPDFDLKSTDGDDPNENATRRTLHELSRTNVRRFVRLPGTRVEGERVAEQLGVEARLGADALESAVRACASPRILHLATHGYFLPNLEHARTDTTPSLLGHGLQNPLLRSGLAFAGANTALERGSMPHGAGDGLLNGEDVLGMDLLATELVVLSACETGLGDVKVGEGVFGLRRAFVLAGAKALVMSLWQVPDEQTAELMANFYQQLDSGVSRADMLRNAQLAIKARFPARLYWGGFVFQGDPEVPRCTAPPLEPGAIVPPRLESTEVPQGVSAGDESVETSAARFTAMGLDQLERYDLVKAEASLRQALAIVEHAGRADEIENVNCLRNLAHVLHEKACYAEAEHLMRRALAILEAEPKLQDRALAVILQDLAQLLKETNRLSEAESLFRRALSVDETRAGPEHPELALDLNNLGVLLVEMKRPSEAEPMFRRALAILERHFGPVHPDVAVTLGNLARLLEANHRLVGAEPLHRRALEMSDVPWCGAPSGCNQTYPPSYLDACREPHSCG